MSLNKELVKKLKSACRGAAPTGVEAKLRIGGLSAPVFVARESIEGFIVTAAGDPGFPRGSKGILRTARSLSEVQVTDLRPVADAPPCGQAEPDQPCPFGLELRRIRDLPLPNDDANLWRAFWRRLTRPFRLSGQGLAVIAGACVLAAILAIAAQWSGTTPADVPAVPPRTFSAPASSAIAGEQAPVEPATAATVAICRKIKHLSGATCFALPELIEDLQLTDYQQRQLQQILTMMNKTLQGIEELRPIEQPQQYESRRQRILSAARRDSLDVLTPPQRARWEAIVGAAP